jgi:RHS repeat-associated protein
VGLDPAVVALFNGQNNTAQPGKPKAYLNVLFFDEQFKMDANASQYRQVGTGTMNPANPWQIGFMAGSAALAKKSGYCYIYISNESNDLVYFDNFTLAHERSSLMEETHYYPFGLTMAGISSKAAGKVENKKKYNGIEFDEDLGIDSYEAFYRNLDPQTGRWWQIDPMCEPNEDPNEIGLESLSPYNSMANNPVKLSDPLGDWPDFVSLGQTLLGFANAYASDNTLGVGLVDGNTQSSDFRLGQTLGHVAAVITGMEEVGLAGGAEIASFGVATPAAVTVAAHGGTTAVIATKRLLSTTVNNSGTSNNTTNTTQSSSRPATKQEAQKVKEFSGGQNRVVLGTPKKKIIYDLNPNGKDHAGVPTPHKMFYKKNFVNGELKSVSRESNKATAVTVADLRMIRKYIESLKK